MKLLPLMMLIISTIVFSTQLTAGTAVEGNKKKIKINTDIKDVVHIDLSGPEGLYLRQKNLKVKFEEPAGDGQYFYTITAKTEPKPLRKNNLDTGRPAGSKPSGDASDVVFEGTFRMHKGKVITDTDAKEPVEGLEK